MIRVVVALLLVVATATVGHAGDDREARARAHYEVGLGQYHLGNYRDAVREFTAGYALSPRPEFLINLGQAYRKLHDLERARDMFQQYLALAPPDAPDRGDVRALLAEVERERAAAPPVSAPPTVAAPVSETPAATPAATSNAAVATAPARSKPGGLRRWWWTIPVGAVVVGTAVGLSLYFGLRSSDVACSSATIACVDVRP